MQAKWSPAETGVALDLRGNGTHRNPRILRQRTHDKQRALRWNGTFLEPNLVCVLDAMASQKTHHRRSGMVGENCVAEILTEVAAQVELCAARFDEQLSGAVVEEEGNVQAFFRDFPPIAIPAFVVLLPGRDAVEKAGHAGDRSG